MAERRRPPRRSTATQVARRVGPGRQAEPMLGLRQMTVVAVSANRNTADVAYAGETTVIPALPCLASYVPAVGDTVWVARNGDDRLILGRTTGADGDLWTPYAPVWTGGDVGNGALVGGYRLLGAKTCALRLSLTWGMTTVSSSTWAFSLPFAAPPSDTYPQALAALANDSDVSRRWGGAAQVGGALIQRVYINDNVAVGASTAQPFAWATDDNLSITGIYELA